MTFFWKPAIVVARSLLGFATASRNSLWRHWPVHRKALVLPPLSFTRLLSSHGQLVTLWFGFFSMPRWTSVPLPSCVPVPSCRSSLPPPPHCLCPAPGWPIPLTPSAPALLFYSPNWGRRCLASASLRHYLRPPSFLSGAVASPRPHQLL